MSSVDPRLAAVLACMTACASVPVSHPAVDTPPVDLLVEMEAVRLELPVGVSAHIFDGQYGDGSRLRAVDLSVPADARAYEESCRKWAHPTEPCRVDEIVFPDEDALRTRLGAPEGSSFTYTVYLFDPHWDLLSVEHRHPTVGPLAGHIIGGVSWASGSSYVHSCSFEAEPRTGVVLDTTPCAMMIVGRPVGPDHRRDLPLDLDEHARRWAHLAADEDEAVQAFRIHLEELRTVGAPDALRQRAQAALRDEQRHRTLALQRASTLAGRTVALGPLRAAVRPRTDRMQILLSVARDGALNETLSYCLLVAEAAAATDPHDQALLQSIASDEAEHAALAWDTLHWAWPSLSAAERAVLLEVIDGPLEIPSVLGALPDAAHVGSHARDHVLAPLIRRLVAPSAPESSTT